MTLRRQNPFGVCSHELARERRFATLDQARAARVDDERKTGGNVYLSMIYALAYGRYGYTVCPERSRHAMLLA